MADSEDVSTLKRRGRRRLLGAIALVLLAVIVLPMIFDSEPRQVPPPVSVRIPSEDGTGFTPKVTPNLVAAPDTKAESKPEPKPEPTSKPVAKAEPKPVTKKEVKVPEAKPVAPAADQFMIPVGAYVDPSGLIAQLKQGKVPHFTEPIATANGIVIRVRAGPFASQAVADKALAQIRALGLKPGKVLRRN